MYGITLHGIQTPQLTVQAHAERLQYHLVGNSAIDKYVSAWTEPQDK